MLKDLNIKDTITSDEISAKIKAIETEQDIALDDRQRLAVSEAVNNGLTIITGGPGTGKTTTIRTIIRYFEKEYIIGCTDWTRGKAHEGGNRM